MAASALQPLFALEDVFHAYLLPHLPLLDMYHLSRTCTAMRSLVSNAPIDCLRTAASKALPPGLAVAVFPVHHLWASLRRQLRLMHRLQHLKSSPASCKHQWVPSPSARNNNTQPWVPPLHLGRLHPQNTLLLWPEWAGPGPGEATVLVLDLPSLEQRHSLQGPISETIGCVRQSVAIWYDWCPNGSLIAILWGRPVARGNLAQLSFSTLHVYVTDTGLLMSKVQLTSPEADGLASLCWLSDGSGFCARSWGIYGTAEVSTVSIAGQVLSRVSGQGPYHVSEPPNYMYTAMSPSDPDSRLSGPVQIIHRMTGKSIAIPSDLFHHLNQCSLMLSMTWSHDGTFASLLRYTRQQRWFMRFDKDRLAYSHLHSLPVAMLLSPTLSVDETEAELFFSPHGRALAIEILYAWQHDVQPKLLTWHLADQPEATFWHVLDFPLPLLSRESPEVGWHPSPSICVCAVAFAGQLGLFCADTNSFLCCWAIGDLIQHCAMYHMDSLSWASHGCQLSLVFIGGRELRLKFDS